MPYYEFKCFACDKIFEIKQSMNEDPPDYIEDCEKGECHLEKLISQVNFKVRGIPKNLTGRTGYVNYGTGKDYNN